MSGAASGVCSELQGADQGHHQQGVSGDDHDVRCWPHPRVLHHHAGPWKKQGTGMGWSRRCGEFGVLWVWC